MGRRTHPGIVAPRAQPPAYAESNFLSVMFKTRLLWRLVIVAALAGCGDSKTEESDESKAAKPEVGKRTPASEVYTKWPFDNKEATRRQQETAKLRGVPTEKKLDMGKGATITLALIPPGKFFMGAPDSDEHAQELAKPRHAVTITEPFYLGVTEVTQDQWAAAMGTGPWSSEASARAAGGNAASFVNWKDAMAFCRALSRKTGNAVRLPTEAEWEYACRAGTTTRFFFGDDPAALSEYAWYEKNASGVGNRYAHPVGKKKPNAWGLFDMHGNVVEWCGDWLGREYYVVSGNSTNPTGPLPSLDALDRFRRVVRGGSVTAGPTDCGSTVRGGVHPTIRNYRLGFRVVVELPPAKD